MLRAIGHMSISRKRHFAVRSPSKARNNMTTQRSRDVEAADMPCEGWWEQDILGRQPMRELLLRFEGGQIAGSGHDIVGPFTIAGTIAADGNVAMVKRYVGAHAVRYVGSYDGEGLMWG